MFVTSTIFFPSTLCQVVAGGVGAVAAGVMVGFQVKELVDLVKSWDTTHPAARTIQELITELDADVTRFKKMLANVSVLVRVHFSFLLFYDS